MYCKQCGKQIPDDSIFCPLCGSSTNQLSSNTHGSKENIPSGISNSRAKNRTARLSEKISHFNPLVRVSISIGLLIVAIICIFQGINSLSSEDYSFYSEHYEDCMEGYEECMDEAKYAGYLLESSYERLADQYLDMAKDDMAKIWNIRIKTIVCIAVAIICALAAYLISFAKPSVSIADLKKAISALDLSTETPHISADDSQGSDYCSSDDPSMN